MRRYWLVGLQMTRTNDVTEFYQTEAFVTRGDAVSRDKPQTARITHFRWLRSSYHSRRIPKLQLTVEVNICSSCIDTAERKLDLYQELVGGVTV